MLSVYGFMFLVQPAILCLTLGSSLVSLGIVWIYFIRRIEKKDVRIGLIALTFILSMVFFSLMTGLLYDMYPIHVEFIRPL